MNIYAFNSFMGVELGLKLTSANKRGLFTVIDWNDDGYCTEKEFRIVFATTKEDIQKAIQNPIDFKNGLILDFVIEQIYHDIVMFKKESISELEEKLDREGKIEISRLAKYLGFYNCKLTDIEIDILAGAGTDHPKTGKRMVPFRRLIERSMSRINIRINFRPSYKKMKTSIGTEEDRETRKHQMAIYYEKQLKEKQEREAEEKRKLELVKLNEDQYSQFEDSDGTPMPQKYMSPAIQKKIESVKEDFGQEFLKMYQKTLFDTIKKSPSKKPHYSTMKKQSKAYLQSNPFINPDVGIPKMMVYDTKSSRTNNRMVKVKSDTAIMPQNNKFKTLQNNINLFRHEWSSGIRRNIGPVAKSQKHWLNDRSQGGFEKLSSLEARPIYIRN